MTKPTWMSNMAKMSNPVWMIKPARTKLDWISNLIKIKALLILLKPDTFWSSKFPYFPYNAQHSP